MPRIIVLSDGGSWEGFNADGVVLMDVTDDAFERLCEGMEPNQLDDEDVEDVTTLQEWKRDAMQSAVDGHENI